MRIATLAGRLVLITEAGAVDVEHASDQRHPRAVCARWDEFTVWARDTGHDDADLRVPAQVFGASFGVARTPQRFLSAGDELVSTIEGIGVMRHRFVEAS